MVPEKSKNIIMKYALQNAVFYGGKADPRAILGKVMASEPGFRKTAKDVREEVERITKEVNNISLEEQKKRLEKLAPALLRKEVRVQEELPPLREAVPGKVVTRFAPSPTGPLSIFQLSRALMLSYLYAKRYKGRFILRIEDTDPRKVEKRYYEMIKEDLKNVGVKWNKILIQSDHMPAYYRYAEKLIRDGGVYACFCPAEKFRKLKLKKQNCECRDFSPKENLGFWKKAKRGDYKDGEVVFRLKTSMQDPNPVLRDPPLLRVNKAKHPLKGNKYKVWPLYNYSCSIDDHVLGVTHVFRGKEHEHNTAVQRRIYEALDWKSPVTINFGMIYLPGEKLHTRDVAERIKSGRISGWDDPSLPTVRALLRRGFSPEAFRLFAIQCGLTKHDINIGWDILYGINRRVIDSEAERYRVVIDPVGINISECLEKFGVEKIVPVQKHPDRKDTREVPVTSRIYISCQDFRDFKNKEVRLLDLFNVRLTKKPKLSKSQLISEKIQKLQWVPDESIPARILKPDSVLQGIGEPGMKSLKVGDVIQMLRIGFGRIDKKGKEIQIIFAHK